MSKQKNRITVGIFLLFLYIILFPLYQKTFPQGDDFMYKISLGEVGQSCKYFYERGLLRTSMFLCMVFSSIDFRIWQIFAPCLIVTLTLVATLTFIGKFPESKREVAVLIMIGSFFSFLPANRSILSDVYFWMSGNIQYIFSTIALLVAAFPIIHRRSPKKNAKLPQIVNFFFIGYCASSHEGIAIAFLSMMVLDLLYKRLKEKKAADIQDVIRVIIWVVFFGVFSGASIIRADALIAKGSLSEMIFSVVKSSFSGVSKFLSTCVLSSILVGVTVSYKIKNLSSKYKNILQMFSVCGIAVYIFFFLSICETVNIIYFKDIATNKILLLALSILPIISWIISCLFLLFDKQDITAFFVIASYVSAFPVVLFNQADRGYYLFIFLGYCIFVECFVRVIDVQTLMGVCACMICFLSMSTYSANRTMKINYKEYQNFSIQMHYARRGREKEISIPTFSDMRYVYINAFHMRYEEYIRKYHDIPEDCKLIYKDE